MVSLQFSSPFQETYFLPRTLTSSRSKDSFANCSTDPTFLEDFGFSLVAFETLLLEGLLKYLRQLYPDLHILSELLSHFPQVTLRHSILLLAAADGIKGAKDLHGLVVAKLHLQHFLKTLAGILSVAPVDVHLAKTIEGSTKVGLAD